MAKLPPIPNAIIAQSVLENTTRFWAGAPESEGKLSPWSTLIIDGLVFPGVKTAGDPGACAVEITGEVKYRIDSQKVKGHDGHRLVADGYEPTKCTALAIFWRQEQWDAFTAYLPVISPKIPRTRQKTDSNGKPVFTSPTTRDVIVPLAIAAPVRPPLLDTAGESIGKVVTGPAQAAMEQYRPSFIVEHPVLATFGLVRVYINEITFPHEHGGRMVRAVKMSLWEVWDIKKKSGNVVKGSTYKLAVDRGRITGDASPGTVSQEPLNPTGKR